MRRASESRCEMQSHVVLCNKTARGTTRHDHMRHDEPPVLGLAWQQWRGAGSRDGPPYNKEELPPRIGRKGPCDRKRPESSRPSPCFADCRLRAPPGLEADTGRRHEGPVKPVKNKQTGEASRLRPGCDVNGCRRKEPSQGRLRKAQDRLGRFGAAETLGPQKTKEKLLGPQKMKEKLPQPIRASAAPKRLGPQGALRGGRRAHGARQFLFHGENCGEHAVRRGVRRKGRVSGPRRATGRASRAVPGRTVALLRTRAPWPAVKSVRAPAAATCATLRVTLHHITLHYITSHCITLHCVTSHCVTLHCITLNCIALHCIAS